MIHPSRAPLPIMANDAHPGAFQLAYKDALSAGVADSIQFSNMDVEDFRCGPNTNDP